MPKLKPARLRALDHARSYLGVKESPPGSNRGPLIDGWLRQAGVAPGNPWCAAFLSAMFAKAGRVLTFPNRASVGYFEQWARANGYLVARPLKGDVVCYRFDGDDWPDHVGIVERVLALRWRDRVFVGWCQTIEGNTSSGVTGSQSDGGGVFRRRRWINRARFARIPG